VISAPGVHSGLGVVALLEAALGGHDPAFRIGEVALGLGLRLWRGWRILIVVLLLSLLFGLFRVLLGLVSRFLFQGRLGFPDLLHPFRLVCHPCG
jgi:hypothetical protein